MGDRPRKIHRQRDWALGDPSRLPPPEDAAWTEITWPGAVPFSSLPGGTESSLATDPTAEDLPVQDLPPQDPKNSQNSPDPASRFLKAAQASEVLSAPSGGILPGFWSNRADAAAQLEATSAPLPAQELAQLREWVTAILAAEGEATATLGELREENTRLQRRVGQLEDTLAECRRTIQLQQMRTQAQDSFIEQQTRDLAQARAQVERLTTELGAAADEGAQLARLAEEMATSQARVAELERVCVALQGRCQEQEETILLHQAIATAPAPLTATELRQGLAEPADEPAAAPLDGNANLRESQRQDLELARELPAEPAELIDAGELTTELAGSGAIPPWSGTILLRKGSATTPAEDPAADSPEDLVGNGPSLAEQYRPAGSPGLGSEPVRPEEILALLDWNLDSPPEVSADAAGLEPAGVAPSDPQRPRLALVEPKRPQPIVTVAPAAEHRSTDATPSQGSQDWGARLLSLQGTAGASEPDPSFDLGGSDPLGDGPPSSLHQRPPNDLAERFAAGQLAPTLSSDSPPLGEARPVLLLPMEQTIDPLTAQAAAAESDLAPERNDLPVPPFPAMPSLTIAGSTGRVASLAAVKLPQFT